MLFSYVHGLQLYSYFFAYFLQAHDTMTFALSQNILSIKVNIFNICHFRITLL